MDIRILGNTMKNKNKKLLSELDQYKNDMISLPLSSTLFDYDKLPVSDFGKEMLRGMGWKEEFNETKVIIKPRPHLLGLGAEPMEVIKKQPKYIKPGQVREKEVVKEVIKEEHAFNIGDYIKIINGNHLNNNGSIIEISKRNDDILLVIKLLNGEVGLLIKDY